MTTTPTTPAADDRVITEGPNAWWRTFDNVVVLAYWLAENDYDGKGVAYGVEKPWKYTPEYIAAVHDIDYSDLLSLADGDDTFDIDTLESRIIALKAARA